MITIRDVVDEIVKLQQRLRGVPSFQWGTVLATNPLTVRTDVDPTPVAGVSTTVACAVGDRVRLERQGSKLTVVGIAGGGADPNEIVIDGVAYQRAGTVPMPSYTLSGSAPLCYALVTIKMPTTPPEGWGYVMVSAIGVTVPSSIIQINGWAADGTMRLMLQAVRSDARITKLAWQLQYIGERSW